jgi:hypothetical protein
MASTPTHTYSPLFSCLYDEGEPVGNLGRGTHYSVMRCAEWRDVLLNPLDHAQVHDFAVIWDEDHDTRVIAAIEAIYMRGLLAPVQFIGERKGGLTVIVAAKFYFGIDEMALATYTAEVEKITQDLPHGDGWPATIGLFDRNPGSPHQTNLQGLIMADEHRVITYAQNIDSLWGLGTKSFVQPRASSGTSPLLPPTKVQSPT